MPVVKSSLVEELEELSESHLSMIGADDKQRFAARAPWVIVATSDVHEHGKLALEQVLRQTGAVVIDGGVSVDPDQLAALAKNERAEAVLVSSYNGIALDYFTKLKRSLGDLDCPLPVLIGGRLNQIPAGSNTSLPVDVSTELAAAGAIVCRTIEDAVPALLAELEYEE